AYLRLAKGLLDRRQQALQVRTRGHFGNDAAKARMQVGLRGDHVGENFQLVRKDGNGGFITGGFDGEEMHVLNPSTGSSEGKCDGAAIPLSPAKPRWPAVPR